MISILQLHGTDKLPAKLVFEKFPEWEGEIWKHTSLRSKYKPFAFVILSIQKGCLAYYTTLEKAENVSWDQLKKGGIFLRDAKLNDSPDLRPSIKTGIIKHHCFEVSGRTVDGNYSRSWCFMTVERSVKKQWLRVLKKAINFFSS